MGAGNPKLKSFDNELFQPTTYFLDLSCKDEEGEPDYDAEEMAYEDLIESICSELELAKINNESHDDLSYAFRNSGLIIAEGEHTYVITESGSEYIHLPIAVIPNFKFEDFQEDIYDPDSEMTDEEKEEKAKEEWKERFEKFKVEASAILKKLKEWYGEDMTQRAGPWTSSKTEDAPEP
jgi:hypothetical protein